MTDESVCRGLHKATQTLRGRWLSRLGRGRRRSRQVGNGGIFLADDETEVGSVGDEAQRADRKAKVVDESDDEPLWLPYVHYGI